MNWGRETKHGAVSGSGYERVGFTYESPTSDLPLLAYFKPPDMTRIFRAAVVCWIVALVVFLRWESAPQAASPIEEQFKYGSIGAEAQEGAGIRDELELHHAAREREAGAAREDLLRHLLGRVVAAHARHENGDENPKRTPCHGRTG